MSPARQAASAKGKVAYGISAASGLPELWIAGWNDSRLDHGGHRINQQLLQAAGSKCNPVHRTSAADQRIANRVAELSAPGATGDGDNADGGN